MFIFKRAPWSALVLCWMAPALGNTAHLREWTEVQGARKGKKGAKLQTHSHGRCDTSSSLRVSNLRGTSCWAGHHLSSTALTGAWLQRHRSRSTARPDRGSYFISRAFGLWTRTEAASFPCIKRQQQRSQSYKGLILIRQVVPLIS